MPESVNSTRLPEGWVAVLTVPEQAVTWRPRTWSLFWKVWVSKPELTWRNCWTRPSSPYSSLPGLIKDTCCELTAQEPAARRWPVPSHKFVRKTSQEWMMALPLTGIRVVDVTNVLAGPFCSYQLALLGAEVIKIEQPGSGDLARRLGADPEAATRGMGASFVAVNAGKQSVTLNLKKPAGKRILKQLAAESNVVLENFRPGVMKRLGLDYEVLSAINPRLIYCAISGFGQQGPLAMRPAYDQIIQGMSGVMSVTGDERSAPLRVGYPVCDTVGGLTAAFAICAALVEAQKTGRGRMIDVSMLSATLATMGWVVSNYLNASVGPLPMGIENFTAAPSATFRTKDGLLNIAANETYQYEILCDLIGRSDLKTDSRFCDRHVRKQNRALI